MKKLKKLSIANLSEVELNERRMGQILGGAGGYKCQCGCHYQGQPGGSTDSSNDSANDADNLHSDSCPQPEVPSQDLMCECELPTNPDCGITLDQVCGRQNLFC